MKRAVMWFGHNEPWLFAVIWAVSLFGNQFAHYRVLTATIVVALASALLLGVVVHERRLCERCANPDLVEVLDPARAVERRRRMLRFYHAHWLRLISAFGLTAVVMLPGRGVLEILAMTAFCALAVVGALSQRIHNRLVPWCPWCGDDWRRDWDDEVAPQPVPTGGAHA